MYFENIFQFPKYLAKIGFDIALGLQKYQLKIICNRIFAAISEF